MKVMKVRYIGPDIGATGLTNGKVYEVTEVDTMTGALRIKDDDALGFDNWSDYVEDCLPGYLYHPKRPKALDGEYKGGRFEIVEDDEAGTLDKAING